MIHISKPNIVPEVLNNDTTKRNFKKNVDAEKFVGSDRYTKIREELSDLYNNKCAYCEKDCDSTHIEHYRPKSIYYWLAYSWDNLLLSCHECNTKKSDKFEINNAERAKYQEEQLSDLHSKISDYDNFENQKLINPEQFMDEKLRNHFTFDGNASIIFKTPEMEHTIEVCDLNRDFLIKKRYAILNDFFYYLNLSSNKTKQTELFVKKLQNSINENEEYIAWKYFLLNIVKLF